MTPQLIHNQSIEDSDIHNLCKDLVQYSEIQPSYYERFDVKRGLRNADGSGVIAGITRICMVHGYVMSEGERQPIPGQLIYRGYDINDLIENAERFGLAQLHQLRGRVGRGAEKSYCILVSDTKTKVAKERMKTMTESEDGFVISEKDLKLRGPGEFFGIRQHGLPELKIADLCRDLPILKEAQAAAAELLRKDRNLEQMEHQPLKARIAGYLDGKRLEM